MPLWVITIQIVVYLELVADDAISCRSPHLIAALTARLYLPSLPAEEVSSRGFLPRVLERWISDGETIQCEHGLTAVFASGIMSAQGG